VRSVIDVIEAIEAATRHKFNREHIEARTTDVDIASLDIAMAKQILNWAPKTKFNDGIRMTVGVK
jgi:UDP-glucose 4-epimerase